MATARTPRRTIPAQDRAALMGKVPPVQLFKEAVRPSTKQDKIESRIFVPLSKAQTDEQVVTGIVLQPDVVDAHGDIIKAPVIRDAAHNFLENYNKATTLGLQHTDFKKRFQLLESYIVPNGLVLNETPIKEGSWVIVVKVLDDDVWEQVKKGEITGFSIGGKARARELNQGEQV